MAKAERPSRTPRKGTKPAPKPVPKPARKRAAKSTAKTRAKAAPARAARQAATDHVEEREILASAAAERLGLTKQAIGLWTAKPGAPVRREGTRVYVRWPDFPRWREEQLVANARRDVPTGSYAERRAAAEARSAEIRMELDEIELHKAQGELVSIEDSAAAAGVMLDRLTARLRALPIALSHLGMDVEAAVETEVERIVAELNGWDEDVLEEPDPDQERSEPGDGE